MTPEHVYPVKLDEAAPRITARAPANSGRIAGGAMEYALRRLRSYIVTGKLAPGEQIRQQEMAELFGVSRVPLREALNVMAKQGLLLHRPNQGYFVIRRSPDELAQIRRMLHLLENELIDSLDWPDAATLAHLRAMNASMAQRTTATDWEEFPQLNRDFHLAIFALSPHRLILEEVQRLWALSDRFIAVKFEQTRARARTVDEHELILNALEERQRSVLNAAMEQHRSSNADGFTRALAEAIQSATEPPKL